MRFATGGSEQSENCQLFVTADRNPKKPAEAAPQGPGSETTQGDDTSEGEEDEEDQDRSSDGDDPERPSEQQGEKPAPKAAAGSTSREKGGAGQDPPRKGNKSRAADTDETRRKGKAKMRPSADGGPIGDTSEAAAAASSSQGSMRSRITNSDSDEEGDRDTAVAVAEEALAITAQPVPASVQSGDSVEFRVGASGGADLRYQWLLNGEPLADGKEATFALLRVGPEHVGEYCCEVSRADGRGGVIRSDVAELKVSTVQAADEVQEIEDIEEIEA